MKFLLIFFKLISLLELLKCQKPNFNITPSTSTSSSSSSSATNHDLSQLYINGKSSRFNGGGGSSGGGGGGGSTTGSGNIGTSITYNHQRQQSRRKPSSLHELKQLHNLTENKKNNNKIGKEDSLSSYSRIKTLRKLMLQSGNGGPTLKPPIILPSSVPASLNSTAMTTILSTSENENSSELLAMDDYEIPIERFKPVSSSTSNDSPLRRLKSGSITNIYRPESANQSAIDDLLGIRCTFENECKWEWATGEPDDFDIITGETITVKNATGQSPGPIADIEHNAKGHFLLMKVYSNTKQKTIKSPQFSTTRETCVFEAYIHQSAMSNGNLRIITEPVGTPNISSVLFEKNGNDFRKWEQIVFNIGKISQDFKIIFEIVPKQIKAAQPYLRGHVGIDNLRLRDCFQEINYAGVCGGHSPVTTCTINKMPACLTNMYICDIDVHCDEGEDEQLNCEKIPFGARCDFENGWCGWQNSGKAIMLWSRNSGPTPTDKTGPDRDHTFRDAQNGHYMYVNMNQHANDNEKKRLVGFASNAVMNSVIFNPPPTVHANATSAYRNSCIARFYVHQYGPNTGSVNLSVVEIKEKENVTLTLWWSSKNLGDNWTRQIVIMPNLTSRYYLQFEARMGMRIYSDVAIDDISLSAECFGINIPLEELQGYNYWDPRMIVNKYPHNDFTNQSIIEVTTCNASGMDGPKGEDCVRPIYNTSALRVVNDGVFKGTQIWTVPNENYYTFIAKGGAGGLGSGGVGSSRGSLAMAVLELHKDEQIHILIGHKGENACIKTMGLQEPDCELNLTNYAEKSPSIHVSPINSLKHQVKNMVIEDGAGGGGGATFVFIVNSANAIVPLLVAGAGGGLGVGSYFDDESQHGKGYDPEIKLNESGEMYGDLNKTGGSGGGWKSRSNSISEIFESYQGASLLNGGRGGEACYRTRGIHGQGGFGGGGGGCYTGGGGGGYIGGDTSSVSTNGGGGTSYVSDGRSKISAVYEGENSESGSVIIIPALATPACGCEYRCIVLDEFLATVICVCPPGWQLKENLLQCEPEFPESEAYIYEILLGTFSIVLFITLTIVISLVYNKIQRKKQAKQQKQADDQDVQLSRLRQGNLTNVNPNYGCDSFLNGGIDIKSLPQISRERLTLENRPLGQGAFGEVYQGSYRHRDGDAVEMPVAVKTLPELSTEQAELDFLMEAGIMAKFSHPNIVHLIGVCFDRHPRYIILELLAGGDLKNFLRDNRPRPDRPTTVTMKDLIFIAIDIAKGCSYLEGKRFIHRDIAARNCLLSSVGPGRVAKIADFGMARDIYRSDYYRKGGKAMLPIKWMPPESFLDGLFTSASDVWAFGVTLWEIFSMGLMPYVGLCNRDVMHMVTGGGRLVPPECCPIQIYQLMLDCWDQSCDERPTFIQLHDRLVKMAEDPDIMNVQLPIIVRKTNIEKSHEIHRMNNNIIISNNNNIIGVPPNGSDYLIPYPGAVTIQAQQGRSVADILTAATCVTIPETMFSYASPRYMSPPIPPPPSSLSSTMSKPPLATPIYTNPAATVTATSIPKHETSFIMSNSLSNQPLLNNDCDDDIDIDDNYNSCNNYSKDNDGNSSSSGINVNSNDSVNGNGGGFNGTSSVGGGGVAGGNGGRRISDNDVDDTNNKEIDSDMSSSTLMLESVEPLPPPEQFNNTSLVNGSPTLNRHQQHQHQQQPQQSLDNEKSQIILNPSKLDRTHQHQKNAISYANVNYTTFDNNLKPNPVPLDNQIICDNLNNNLEKTSLSSTLSTSTPTKLSPNGLTTISITPTTTSTTSVLTGSTKNDSTTSTTTIPPIIPTKPYSMYEHKEKHSEISC